MKVKRNYCKPESFVLLDDVELSLLAGSYTPPIGGSAGTGETPEENPFAPSRRDSTFVDDEDVEPEIWTGYKKYNGFE